MGGSVLDPTILVSCVPPNVPHERSLLISQCHLYHVKKMCTPEKNNNDVCLCDNDNENDQLITYSTPSLFKGSTKMNK